VRAPPHLTIPDGAPAPAGFPACRACPYRRAPQPGVCLACLRRSTPEPPLPPVAPRRMTARVPAGCAACGQPLTGDPHCANPWCGRADRAWSVAFSVGVHEGPLRRALVDYKYRGHRWWGAVLARLLADWLRAHETWVEEFDLLVPVPSYLGAGARRGWDPVGELAAGVARTCGAAWDVIPQAIIKTAETPPMTARSRTSRLALAEGPLRAALAVPDRAAVAGARILVLDDVLTEGATLREVARCLRAAGAIEVAGLAITRPAWTGPGAPTGPH
jgi:predicted amidophosphoribosyltransferase